jgi:hypothetical protein
VICTELQNSGAVCEPDRNVYAECRRVSHEVCYAECRRLGTVRCGSAAVADGKIPTVNSSEHAAGHGPVVSSGTVSSLIRTLRDFSIIAITVKTCESYDMTD